MLKVKIQMDIQNILLPGRLGISRLILISHHFFTKIVENFILYDVKKIEKQNLQNKSKKI